MLKITEHFNRSLRCYELVWSNKRGKVRASGVGARDRRTSTLSKKRSRWEEKHLVEEKRVLLFTLGDQLIQ